MKEWLAEIWKLFVEFDISTSCWMTSCYVLSNALHNCILQNTDYVQKISLQNLWIIYIVLIINLRKVLHCSSKNSNYLKLETFQQNMTRQICFSTVFSTTLQKHNGEALRRENSLSMQTVFWNTCLNKVNVMPGTKNSTKLSVYKIQLEDSSCNTTTFTYWSVHPA
jgi:hypothetical protein